MNTPKKQGSDETRRSLDAMAKSLREAAANLERFAATGFTSSDLDHAGRDTRQIGLSICDLSFVAREEEARS